MQKINKFLAVMAVILSPSVYAAAPSCSSTSPFNWSNIEIDELVSKESFAEVHFTRGDGTKGELVLDYARTDSKKSFSLLMVAATSGKKVSFTTGYSCVNDQAGIINVGVQF
jgi:hypothetical protein